MLNVLSKSENIGQSKTAIVIISMFGSGSNLLSQLLEALEIESTSTFYKNKISGSDKQEDIFKIHEKLLSEFGLNWSIPINLPKNWLSGEKILYYKKMILENISLKFTNSKCFVVNDPRVGRILPIWFDLLKTIGFKIKLIMLMRNPCEIALKQNVKNKIDYEISYLLWLKYCIEPFKYFQNEKYIVVSFEEILNNYQLVLSDIIEGLNLEDHKRLFKDNYGLSKIIDTDLYHHKFVKPITCSKLENEVLNIYNFLIRNSKNFESLNKNLLNANSWLYEMNLVMEPVLISLYKQLFAKQNELADLEEMLLTTNRNIDDLNNQLEEIKNSGSWKITEPLRKIHQKIEKKQTQ